MINIEANWNDHRELYVLVEAPEWCSVKFYGQWLLAAADAQELWKKSIEQGALEVEAVTSSLEALPDFGIAATVMLSLLEKEPETFIIPVIGYEANEFAMMIEMGFFALANGRYRMTIPAQLNTETVKKAASKFAETAVSDCCLHPEYLIAAMTVGEARAAQDQLRKMRGTAPARRGALETPPAAGAVGGVGKLCAESALERPQPPRGGR